MEKSPIKLSPTREHSRQIVQSLERLSLKLESARRSPIDDVADFLKELHVTLKKLIDVSEKEIRDGNDGVSITKAYVKDKNLFIEMSNGQTFDAGKVVGEDGFDGDDADEDKILSRLKTLIPEAPKVDEEKIVNRLKTFIPKPKKQETFAEFFSKIKKNKMLSFDDIAGIEKFEELIKRYIGPLEMAVHRPRPVAGTNALGKLLDIDFTTATSNAKYLRPVFVNGKLASFEFATPPGSGGINQETPSGTVDGSNNTFTVSNEPQFVIADGATYFDGAGYSYSGGTITMDSPPFSSIRSIY